MTADISEATLRQRLGAAAVVTDSIHLGEGESELGTVLYPDQPARRLEVLWVDQDSRTRPRIIYVRGGSSAWRLFPGVGIGTSLKTLDSINGRSLSLFGFGWDYAGTTSAYNGGRLDSLWGQGAERAPAVRLRLAPASGAPESLLTQVAGDRVFSSNQSGDARAQP